MWDAWREQPARDGEREKERGGEKSSRRPCVEETGGRVDPGPPLRPGVSGIRSFELLQADRS